MKIQKEVNLTNGRTWFCYWWNNNKSEAFIFPSSNCHVIRILNFHGTIVNVWNTPQVKLVKEHLQTYQNKKLTLFFPLLINDTRRKSLPEEESKGEWVGLLRVSDTLPWFAAEAINWTTRWWLDPITTSPSTHMISSPVITVPSWSAAPPGTICPIDTCRKYSL